MSSAPSRSFSAAVAALIALSAAFVVLCYSHGWILYYGDAQAHLDNARRIIDSRTPGYYQLGTVWLPLPHVLMLPLVWNTRLWQTGLAGAIPAAVCFIAGGIFLYLSARRAFQSDAAAWASMLVYALNPNLLYLQSTPMTEPIFQAALLAILYLTLRYRDTKSTAALVGAACVCLAATLTRYDGWFLIPFVTAYVLLITPDHRLRAAVLFGAIASAGAAWWLVHNWWVFGDAMAWYHGPGSAKAIQAGRPYAGYHDWRLAGLYFRTVAVDVIGVVPFAVAAVGLLGVIWRRAWWPFTLLLLPPAFYVLSIHSGSVPIHVPELWPHSYYNTRYGLAALPVIAFCAGGLVVLAPARRVAAAIVALAVAIPWALHPRPDNWLCWKESQVNSVARRAWTEQAAAYLEREYHGGGILASSGDITGVLCRASIPLRETLNNGNYPDWAFEVEYRIPVATEEWALDQAGDQLSQALHAGRLFRIVHRVVVPDAPAVEIWRRN